MISLLAYDGHQGLIENGNCALLILFRLCRTMSLNYGGLTTSKKWELAFGIKRKLVNGTQPYSRFSEIIFLRGRSCICKEEQIFFQKQNYDRSSGKYLELVTEFGY